MMTSHRRLPSRTPLLPHLSRAMHQNLRFYRRVAGYNTFAAMLKRPRPWQTSVPLCVRCSVLGFAVAITRHLEPILSQLPPGHLRPGVRCAVRVNTSGCSPIVLVLLGVGDDWAVDRELVRDGPEARRKAVSPSGSRNGAGRGRRKMTARGRGSSCFAVTFATLTVVAGKGWLLRGTMQHDANAAHRRVTDKKPRQLSFLPIRVSTLFAQPTRNLLVLLRPTSSLDQRFTTT